MESVMNTVLGLFSGAGIILLWEALLRPLQTKRKVARVLALEVSRILEDLEEIRAFSDLTTDTLRQELSTSFLGFDAVKEDLGTLSVSGIQKVLGFYGDVQHLARVLQQLDPTDPRTAKSLLLRDFDRNLREVITGGDNLLDTLVVDGVLLGSPSLKTDRVRTANANAAEALARISTEIKRRQ